MTLAFGPHSKKPADGGFFVVDSSLNIRLLLLSYSCGAVSATQTSLQLGFLVQHMLARLGIEFQEFELFGRCLLVLVGRVEMAGTGR